MKLSKKFVVGLAATAIVGSFGITAASAATIVAGGATFPLNLMESCRASFAGDSTANSAGHKVDYTGVGSGTGKANFFKNDYTFGMSDSVWKTSEITTAVATTGGASRTATNFVFLPLISGAINVAYNLEGVKPAGTVLQMSSATVAKIFAAQIKTWNDPAILADNPVAAQPKLLGLNGQTTFTLAKKSATKATLVATLTSKAVTSKSKNLIITSSTDGGTTTKKIYNKKPKAGKITLSVPYAAGTVYSITLDKALIGSVSVDATSVTIPATPITVYKRKDTSGTTNNFANYLNKSQPTVWTKETNDAFDTAFPGTVPTDGSFVAAQGNDGVANGVMGKNGGIGYAETSFVNERQTAGKSIQSAKIKNGAGEYLAGSSAGAKLAVSAATVSDTTGIVTFKYDNAVAGAYPITAVSYGMANTAAFGTAANNAIAKSYVLYVLDTCAPAVAEIKGYAALPDSLVAIAKTLAAKIGA
ncbi:MAG: substrate-binding domain-containing protein [Ilumatobacteraceae bacterium]|nr:substrate-binding domain-containing protein [Ilumatobacteraceae bacterium]